MRLYKRTFKQENRREVENTDKKSWIAWCRVSHQYIWSLLWFGTNLLTDNVSLSSCIKSQHEIFSLPRNSKLGFSM